MTSVLSGVERRPSFVAAIVETTRRGSYRLLRRPSLFIPSLLMPVFFVVAFSGSFGGIARDPAYGTDNTYNWMTAYAILQGAAFAGSGAAGMTAEDIENGFYDRLLLAPGARSALLAGPVVYAATRSLMPALVVPFAAWLVGGLDMPGGPLAMVMAIVGAIGTAVLFGLLSLAAVFWLKTQRALLLSSLFVFSSLFMSTGQVPLDFQTGWLRAASENNPLTPVLDLTRQGFIGEVTWAATWPGLVSIGVCSALLGALAYALLRRMAP